MEQRSTPVRLGSAMDSGNKPRTLARDISESLGKLPPQALDLEESILGAIMLEKHVLKRLPHLKTNHFYSDQHKEIFQACVDLQNENNPVDMRTVVAQLRSNGKIEVAGGAFYIAELTSKVSSAANVEYHARIVIEMSLKRDLIYIASQIHHDAYEDTTDVFDLLKKSEKAIVDLENSKGSTTNIIEHNSAASVIEFKNGKPIGEKSGVQDLSDIFSWKKTFMNCWTGWPNDGKSSFFQFMAIVKFVRDEKSKICLWSPEMISSRKSESGKIEITATDLEDEIIFTYTGKNPYKHIAEKYHIPQMSLDEYMEAAQWVKEHFVFINPSQRKYSDLLDNFKYAFETFGCDMFLIDPFKNLDQKDNAEGRTDLYLDKVFSECKRFAIDTNSSFNFIAHPRSQVEPKDSKGAFKVCTQYMLAGGASWDNNMDGIYSIHRPNRHQNPNDPMVNFYTLKQRKQNLVGRRGICENIEFDFNTNRYFFGDDKVCPIDGSFKNPKQTNIFEKKLHQPKEIEFKVDNQIEGKKEDDGDDLPF